MTARRFRRVLIANRGEIAVRILRSLRDLGIEGVVVYSDADANGMARRMADVAVRLPGKTSAETYLNIPLLTEVIRKTGADAVHPGYGFLSENAAFAEACAKAGAKFIGPPVKAMHLMGNKVEARRLMKAHGVPVVPGSEEPLANAAELKALAREIGLPLILKAAAGGGGRGMRVVRDESEIDDAFAACAREAEAYFGDKAVFCERYIENPRHIEFQVLFDEHGNSVHLFERDCSIQRRHQKLLEEAPSAFLNDAQRAEFGAMAVRAARAAGYTGAGTIELICESPERVYFMEMNTRIQVEHPVTEMVTGIDLISWQIRVAQGEPLAFTQQDVRLRGWAIEARINAEDPLADFMPAPGLVTGFTLPAGPDVRVDTHLYPGYEIPSVYDSMVAKLIVAGEDRHDALRRLRRALSELVIDGVPTTSGFHEALCQHPVFQSGDFTTRFLEQHGEELKQTMRASSGIETKALLAALLVSESQGAPRHGLKSADDRSHWQKAGRVGGIQ